MITFIAFNSKKNVTWKSSLKFLLFRDVNISLPDSTLKNGSLYVHVFLGPKGKSPLRHSDMGDLSSAVVPLTKYAVPQSTVYSLLTGSDQGVREL